MTDATTVTPGLADAVFAILDPANYSDTGTPELEVLSWSWGSTYSPPPPSDINPSDLTTTPLPPGLLIPLLLPAVQAAREAAHRTNDTTNPDDTYSVQFHFADNPDNPSPVAAIEELVIVHEHIDPVGSSTTTTEIDTSGMTLPEIGDAIALAFDDGGATLG